MDMGSPNSKGEDSRTTARLSSDGERRSLGFSDTGSSQKILTFDESGERARIDLIEDHYAEEDEKKKKQLEEGTSVQTQVFRSEQADGSVVTTTVRTTRTTTRSSSGDFVTAIEVQTTTETETKDRAKRTSVATETSTETVAGQVSTIADNDEDANETGDDVQTQVFRSEGEGGSIVTKTVRTTRRTVMMNGVAATTVDVQTTTETETKDGAKSTNVSTETRTEVGNGSAGSVTEEKASFDGLAAGNEHDSRRSFMFGKKRKYHKQWHPQFVAYLDRHDKRVETLSTADLLECARAFCHESFAEFHPELFNGESTEESKACWQVVTQIAAHYPLVAVQSLALDFGKKNLLILDEVTQGFDSENRLRKEVAVSMLGHSKAEACQVFDDLLVLKGGKVVYHGAGEDIVEYFNDLGYQCAPGHRVAQFLLNLAGEQEDRYRIMIPIGSKPDEGGSHFFKNFAVFLKYADDAAMIAGGNTPMSMSSPESTMKFSENDVSSTTVSVIEEANAVPGKTVKTEMFRSEEADGSIVTKTVRTTTHTETSPAGELVATIEVETTTQTETKSGEKSTTVETETREETEVEESSLATTSGSTTTVSGGRAIRSTVEAGAAPGESVQTEVFQSQEADGSIVTKTVKTTTRTSTSASGELVKTIEVETTTETETKSGEKSTTVETETREETEVEESSLATTSGSTTTVSGGRA
ncbi:hypothetical protein PC120_g25638, partial [Phytophthora cactorum]